MIARLLKRGSLTRRLVLTLLTVQIVTILAAPVAATLVYWHVDRENNRFEGVLQLVDTVFEALQDVPAPERLDLSSVDWNALEVEEPGWFVVALGDERVTRGDAPADALVDFASDELTGLVARARLTEDGSRSPSVIRSEPIHGRVVRVAAGGIETGWTHVLSDVAYVMSLAIIWVMLPLIGLTLLAIPAIARGLLKQVNELARTAQSIHPDRRGARLDEARAPSEIAPLVAAFNATLERLDEDAKRKTRLIADAAHELRTPIAILRTRLDELPAAPIKDALVFDTRRLSRLTDQLLDVQKLRGGVLAKERFDLVALARSVLSDLAPRAFDAGYEPAFIEPNGHSPLEVTGNPDALRRAIANLIDNAIRYGGGRGVIEIELSLPGIVLVRDEGPGVPRDQAESIFEPFHRGASSGEGAGLGLHLAREVAAAHGGEVRLVHEKRQGATFLLDVGSGDRRDRPSSSTRRLLQGSPPQSYRVAVGGGGPA